MPVYLFRHPGTDLVIEELQKMNDPHVYIDDDGVEWERVWTSPNAGIDTKLDGSKKSFMKYTADKKGNMGDLWDASRRCSDIREKQRGKDPVKDKYFKNYSERRRGKKHQQDPKGENSGKFFK
jgi:hypothetical protein